MSDEKRFCPAYLGDAVYVYLSDYREVVLYTSDGIREQNRIVLGVEEVEAFSLWLQRAIKLVGQLEEERSKRRREERVD